MGRRDGVRGLCTQLTPTGVNVCIGRASSLSPSQSVGGGVAHLSLSLKPGSR